jgi:signal transduction histidine kinase
MKSAVDPARQKNSHLGLKGKLIRIMIVVGTLPLILAMIVSYVQGNKSLRGVIGSSFKALAYETSSKIDFMMKEEIHKNSHMANHPGIINYLNAQESLDKSTLENRWQNGDPQMLSLNPASLLLQSFLEEGTSSNKATQTLYITDNQGRLSASINFSPQYMNRERPAWSKTHQGDKGFAYIGPLEKDPKTGEFLFEIAVPIRSNNMVKGVLHHVYWAKNFFSSWIETIQFGSTGHVMLITSDGTVLDCPVLPTGFKLADPELVRSVTGPHPDWVETHGNGHDDSREISLIGYSPLPETAVFTRKSSGQEWFTFAWQASDELFDPTHKLFLWISAAGFFSILLIVMMGSLASDKIVKPIKHLQETAGRIGRGERVEVDKVSINTGDEIELLAGEINTMNKMIRAAFAGLEDQVKEKTREVIYLQEYTDGILKSIPDPLLIFNEKLEIEYMNPAFNQFVGLKETLVIGKKLMVIDLPHQSNWKRLSAELLEYSQGVVPKNPHEIQGQFIHCYEPRDPLSASKSPLRKETTLSFSDRVFAYQFFEVMLQVEESRRIGLFLREITQEKRLQDQLALAEKLSGLGRLSAGIAHEMNNPLYSIMGYIEAILEEDNPEKIKTYASKVLGNSKHMAAIIQNLSGYTRSSLNDKTQDVNINERLDAAIEIALMASLSRDVTLEKRYSNLPLTKAKPEEIQQIFINIVANAVQAMQGNGRLTVTSEKLDGNILVRIQDTGPGIPAEHLPKIFDPFFTTKDQGQGTGLGLNIVHKIAEKYGGHISVESQVGSGTTFILRLPVNT